MKKHLLTILTLALTLSFGTMAMGEDTFDLEVKEGGFRVSLPKDLMEKVKIETDYEALPDNEGIYTTSFSFGNLGENLETPEEAYSLMPYVVVSATSEEFIEQHKQNVLAEGFNVKSSKLGEADGFCFYLFDYVDQMEKEDSALPESDALEYERYVSILGDALPGITLFAPEKEEDKFTGRQLSFETTDMEGNPVKSEELFAQNKLTVLDVWETTCGDCISELPELEKTFKAYLEENGCALVGLLMDGTSEELIETGKGIIEENQVTYLNLLPPQNSEVLSEIENYPTKFFVDSEGMIRFYIEGANTDVSLYEKDVTALLEENEAELSAEMEPEAEPEEPVGGTYRVLVYDSEGKAVEGVKVQFCSSQICLLGDTDAQGVASFDMPGGEAYIVHLLKVPEGYAKDTQEYLTEETPGDLAITLNKVQ